MFEEMKKEYENYLDKTNFRKKIHNMMMQIKDIKCLLDNSIIDKIEFDKNSFWITLKKDYGEVKLYINEFDFEEVPISIICFGDYEKSETNMTCKILDFFKDEKDFTCFDIGANVGWYTLNILKRFDNMNVFSFEPSPITFQRLEKNLELNQFATNKLFNIGFFDKNDKLDFYYDTQGSGASSLVNIRERDSVKKISVDMMKLDDWVKINNVKKVDFIKCDVEGAEYFVYQGGIEFISKNKPIIFSEMLRKWSAKFGYTPNDIIEFMKKLGYKCYVIYEDFLKEFNFVDENTIETNYYFLHAEKHKELIKELVKS